MPSAPINELHPAMKSDIRTHDHVGEPHDSKSQANFLRRATATTWAMLRMRCPQCHAGRMFRGTFKMNDPCPVCGLLFQREEGYFLGAMYVSYILGVVILTPIFIVLYLLLPDWNPLLLTLLAFLPYLPLMPLVFRYSRVGWVYFDRAVCPSAVSAGAYEKVRLEEIAHSHSSPADEQNHS
jgi:uncharacterized protein (DUF983 family)